MNVFLVLLVAAVFLIATTPRVRRKRIISKFDPGKLTSKSPKLDPEKRKDKQEGIRLGDDVFWSPAGHPNPHVLILGGSGSGKTWTIRLLARELLELGYLCVLFDFHGDLGIPEAATHRISLDSKYGVNPLALSLDPTGGGPDLRSDSKYSSSYATPSSRWDHCNWLYLMTVSSRRIGGSE